MTVQPNVENKKNLTLELQVVVKLIDELVLFDSKSVDPDVLCLVALG